MSTDPLEELLRRADDSAPRLLLRPPRLADLEDRRRSQIARRGGAMLSIALLVASATWATALRNSRHAELLDASTESLTSSLAELGGLLASLQADPEPTASTASEEAAMATFRALHRGANRGDAHSIDGMRWLAERFSTTRGGRCAQLCLADHDGQPTGRQRTEPSADTHPTKR